jgi:hypothetical protein
MSKRSRMADAYSGASYMPRTVEDLDPKDENGLTFYQSLKQKKCLDKNGNINLDIFRLKKNLLLIEERMLDITHK